MGKGAATARLSPVVTMLLASCAVLASCGTANPGTDACGHVKTEERAIVNGTAAPDPEVVDLTGSRIKAIGLVETDLGRCTGTLVSWDVVVTAAHCVEGWPAEIEFVAGDYVGYGSPKLRVAGLHTHPLYAWPDYDVAVLVLADDPAEHGIVPIPLDLDPPPILDERIQSAGYGRTEPDGGGSNTLMWTTQEVIDEDAMFYYAWDGGSSGTCFGDSGGPILYQVPGEGVRVLGDLSAMTDAGCLGVSAYMRSDAVRDWLSTFVEYGPCGIERESGRCEGDVAVWCEDDAVRSEDCAEAGLECGEDGSGLARCVTPCDGETVEGRCEGDTAIWCEAGEAVAWDCTRFDYVCAEDASGNHRCASECSILGGAGACDGDTARWCEAGVLKTEACDDAGLACGRGADGRARCMEECAAIGHDGECEAGIARWCEDGRLRERDCAACGMECAWTGDALGYYCVEPGWDEDGEDAGTDADVADSALDSSDPAFDVADSASDLADTALDPADTVPDLPPDAPPDAPDAPTDVPVDAPDDDAAGDPDAEEEAPCEPGDAGAPPTMEMDACLKVITCSSQYGYSGSAMYMYMCTNPLGIDSMPLKGDLDTMIYIESQIAMWAEVRTHEACIVAAAGCEGVFACMNGGLAETCTITVPSWNFLGLGCDGTVLETCAETTDHSIPGLVFEHDCADDGRECVDLGYLGAACGSTGCTTPGDPGCAGAILEYCASPGAMYTKDCTSPTGFGPTTCGDADPDTTGLQAGCVPSGAPCDTSVDPYNYCEGAVQHQCDTLLDTWTWTDCTVYGPLYGCREMVVGGDSFYGCLPDTTGSGCTFAPWSTCDCEDLLLCDTETETDVRIHCPDYGYAMCAPLSTLYPFLGAYCSD